MLILNTKQELLDWAVDNIKEWEQEYTHLRCDKSTYPFFSSGFWEEGELFLLGWWQNVGGNCWSYCRSFNVNTSTPLVISKQEYMEAKNMKENEFKLEYLKTGMLVTLSNGDIGYFFDAFHGYKEESGSNQHIFVYVDENRGWDDLKKLLDNHCYVSIVKVEYANNLMHLLTKLKDRKMGAICWDTLWERKEETESQKQLRELKAKQDELVKSQQEVAKMISELEGKV